MCQDQDIKKYNIKLSPKPLYQLTLSLVTQEFWFSILLITLEIDRFTSQPSCVCSRISLHSWFDFDFFINYVDHFLQVCWPYVPVFHVVVVVFFFFKFSTFQLYISFSYLFINSPFPLGSIAFSN